MADTIILMRHGAYNPLSGSISEEGREQVESTAEQMIEQGLVPDTIVHSPVLRAGETAKQLSGIFNSKATKVIPREVHSCLAEWNLSTPKDLRGEILNDAVLPAKVILLVTHQPNISGLSLGLSGSSVMDTKTAEALVYRRTKKDEVWGAFEQVKRIPPSGPKL